MQTRMEKYTETHDDNLGLRYKRNAELYQKISDQELDKYTVKANATVLGDNGPSIDVEHIKKILETKYNNTPKRKSIVIPEEVLSEEETDIIETKEYDINLILEKAKEQENNSYDKNRFKKLKDTQYDILKDLNLSEPTTVEDEKKEKDELLELINTITQKELENKKNEEDDPLDLFPDLKGSENTVVLEGMQDEIKNLDTANNNVTVSDDGKVPSELDESFYTTSTVFTQSDFDDFEDLKKEVKGHKVVLAIVTTLIIVALIFCILFVLKNFLGINFLK